MIRLIYFRNLPNVLSVIRIVLTPVFIVFFLWGSGWLITSLFVFTLAALTDTCDGYLARRYNITSEIGNFLDPLADKILVFGIFGVFYVRSIIPGWFLGLIVLRELCITFLRIIMLKSSHALVTSRLAKIKTTAQFVLIYLLFLRLMLAKFYLYDAFAIIIAVSIYVTAFLTVYSAYRYVIKNFRAMLVGLKKLRGIS